MLLLGESEGGGGTRFPATDQEIIMPLLCIWSPLWQIYHMSEYFTISEEYC